MRSGSASADHWKDFTAFGVTLPLAWLKVTFFVQPAGFSVAGACVVISMTDCYRESDYGEPIVALKSYITSPFSDDKHVDTVLESLWKARRTIAAEDESKKK